MFVTVIIDLPSISEVCFKYRFIKKSQTCDLLPVMQADRQIEVSPVGREVGSRE
jgi:hypothetical protein